MDPILVVLDSIMVRKFTRNFHLTRLTSEFCCYFKVPSRFQTYHVMCRGYFAGTEIIPLLIYCCLSVENEW